MFHIASILLYPFAAAMHLLGVFLLFLFGLLLHGIANVPVAIVLLSVCVKLLMAPLFALANRWQRQVNRNNALLRPLISEIKRGFKGEEQNRRIVALHRELGISPLYTLKSLFGLAIQVPIFIAVYEMLCHNGALVNKSALWIQDLSLPDRLLPLPFTIPLFGNAINILPLIMTGITLFTACIYKDDSISAAALQSHRRNLCLLGGVFLLLLFTSPSGVVLYWTVNNILSLLSTLKYRFAGAKAKG